MGVRGCAAVAVLMAVACLAPAAAADSPSLQPNGSLTYVWRGDPARGCARIGVCGIHGVLIVRPDDAASLNGDSQRSAELDLVNASVTARVSRDGSPGTCIDTPDFPDTEGSQINVRFPAAGGARAVLSGAASAGRCAGPLASQLSAIAFPARRSGAKGRIFDFGGTVAFAAGAYSGSLTSTLRFAPMASELNGGFFSSGSSSSGPGQRTVRVRLEQVAVHYRVAIAAGALSVPFAGNDSCAVLDACGARGTLSLPVRASHVGLTLVASRVVGSDVSRRQILADFVAGRLSLQYLPPLAIDSPRVIETVSGPAGTACTDSEPAGDALSASLQGVTPPNTLTTGFLPSRRVQVVLTVGYGEILRTACPGPLTSDVFGADSENNQIGQAAISTANLLRMRTRVPLSVGGGFAARGYSGSRQGGVLLTLTRERLRTGTVTETEPAL